MTSNDSNPARVRRILLAEDNPHDQLLLDEAFRSRHLAVEIDLVADGDEVGTRLSLENPRYDLVVLDARLPRCPAEDVLLAFRERGGMGVPCVVVSSAISNLQRNQLLELGATAVLTKPMDLDEYGDFALAIYTLML